LRGKSWELAEKNPGKLRGEIPAKKLPAFHMFAEFFLKYFAQVTIATRSLPHPFSLVWQGIHSRHAALSKGTYAAGIHKALLGIHKALLGKGACI
jgi:hypothetical protein